MGIENISNNKVFDGWHKQYSHHSAKLNCQMRFAIYLPPQASSSNRVPVMYWLSGLTCSDENFMQKAGALRIAALLGIAIVAPDTSPRGEGVADDRQQAYDLGLGAGFYVNATQTPWDKHYQMYDYVADELPKLIEKHFPVNAQRVISGHSMGGHGALVIALRNPTLYQSVSAFSPICNPINCAWGKKAFTAYLGADQAAWRLYDASELMAAATAKIPAMVDQGSHDDFLEGQLKPNTLLLAAKENHYPLIFNMAEGYDHSYYFISTFIEQHLRFHAQHLGLLKQLD
ncbi:S-formylglutathione hydrolase [Psychromonas antarctica]|uniref:S-formylglutathione hydrolase n=1 Tax=Psychromonas antarctica TaxID=67573 RepID=UPI001EE94838|nr:S-formylglutathione hydrolase [Psychromonas antarctica]MCG6199979.1 S-formylglutathione hydrolase [Psychromonas antarctica]